MDDGKVYLEPDLTMLKLAALVACSVNQLSQAVNSGFGMSFFDFLNSYRIKEAKVMLSQTGQPTQAMLDVSFAVGFNSNSAFYAAFRKATGQTPAQYRRACMETC
ncbi:MAG: AraC family transcriptional regulator [Gammaproteobacteria bacterium]|nr:AraC family transcriptional regulator [Gammaproteobacteria bacterium]